MNKKHLMYVNVFRIFVEYFMNFIRWKKLIFCHLIKLYDFAFLQQNL